MVEATLAQSCRVGRDRHKYGWLAPTKLELHRAHRCREQRAEWIGKLGRGVELQRAQRNAEWTEITPNNPRRITAARQLACSDLRRCTRQCGSTARFAER
jgi:hypothetical protein